MKWFSWKYLRDSSFLITPNLPVKATKNYKFSMLRIIAYMLIYTFFSWMVLILILGTTPLKDFLFVLDNKELKVQTEKINDLQAKVNLLTYQLQSISSTNERMKFALELARQDSIDSTNAIYDSLRSNIGRKIKIGGSIYEAFKIFVNKFFPDTTFTDKINFLSPSVGIITQSFQPDKGHMGIDFGLKIGSPVLASASGLVIFSDYTTDNGFMLMIEHDQNYITIYKHCSSLLKKTRDFVTQGELIALSGNSGKNTTGPHLHFEIWQKGKPFDPEKILIK